MTSTVRGLDKATEEEFLSSLYSGGEYLAAGRLEEARGFLEKARGLQPQHEKALNLLGLTYFKLGDFPRAASVYESLVDGNPADATLRVNLGLVYLKSNNVLRAVKEFETATDLEPEHKKAHNYLGLALAQTGEFERARQHFIAAGSDAMAEKMVRALESTAPAAEPPPPPAPPPPPMGPPPLPVRRAPEPPPEPPIEVMSEEAIAVPAEQAPLGGDWGAQVAPGTPLAEEPPLVEEVEVLPMVEASAEEPPPPGVTPELAHDTQTARINIVPLTVHDPPPLATGSIHIENAPPAPVDEPPIPPTAGTTWDEASGAWIPAEQPWSGAEDHHRSEEAMQSNPYSDQAAPAPMAAPPSQWVTPGEAPQGEAPAWVTSSAEAAQDVSGEPAWSDEPAPEESGAQATWTEPAPAMAAAATQDWETPAQDAQHATQGAEGPEAAWTEQLPAGTGAVAQTWEEPAQEEPPLLASATAPGWSAEGPLAEAPPVDLEAPPAPAAEAVDLSPTNDGPVWAAAGEASSELIDGATPGPTTEATQVPEAAPAPVAVEPGSEDTWVPHRHAPSPAPVPAAAEEPASPSEMAPLADETDWSREAAELGATTPPPAPAASPEWLAQPLTQVQLAAGDGSAVPEDATHQATAEAEVSPPPPEALDAAGPAVTETPTEPWAERAEPAAAASGPAAPVANVASVESPSTTVEPTTMPSAAPPPVNAGYTPMGAPKLVELGATTQWVAEPSQGPFQISPDGLAVSVSGEMLTRMTGLVAIMGAVEVKAETRRVRGRATETPFGQGPQQLHRVTGNGVLYLEPGKARFHAFDLDDEGVYLREERIFAFEEPIAWENGRLQADGGQAMDLVHLKGQGRVLLQLDGTLRAMPIPAGTPMVVPLVRAVGWFGHVTPRLMAFAGQVVVELTGEGHVLLGAAPERA